MLQTIPVSLPFIATENWPGQTTNSKSVFFLSKTSKRFDKIEFYFFCCTTPVGMLLVETFSMFLHEGFWEIWLGLESVTHRQTDIHGGDNNISLSQGDTYKVESFRSEF